MKDIQLSRKLVARVLSYARKYKGILIITGILLFLSNGFGLGFPLLVKKIVDIVLVEDLGWIVLTWWCIGGVACVAFKGVVDYASSILNAYVSQNLTIDIREDFFGHLMRLPLNFFDNRRTGDISSRAFNDVGQLQGTIIIGTLYFFKDILFLIGLIVIIFLISWKAFLIFIGGTIVVGIFTEWIRKRTRQVSSLFQKKIADLNTHFLDAMSLIKEIKLFLQQKKMTAKFSNMNREYLKIFLKDTKLQSSTGPVSDFVFTITMLSIVWLAGVMERGTLTPGSVVSLFIYLQYVFGPVMGIMGFIVSFQRVLACGERVFEVFSVEPEVEDLPTDVDIQPEVKWDIKFKDVVLKYDTENIPAINGVNLEIENGEIIALVGPNGSGKTSLARLLLRLYEPTSGSIQIDGIDINRVKLRSLRERIGIIPQDPVLFHGTVYENIAFGKEGASLEEVIEVSRISKVHEIITELPDTYDTIIGERGVKLSGGERQAIAIARTILKNPDLLIMDEATSYLDPKMEVAICEAIMDLRKGMTTIIIAHRPLAVVKAERIVVMNNGQIKEIGGFEELM